MSPGSRKCYVFTDMVYGILFFSDGGCGFESNLNFDFFPGAHPTDDTSAVVCFCADSFVLHDDLVLEGLHGYSIY